MATNYYNDPSDPDSPTSGAAPFIDRVRYFDGEFLSDQDFVDDQMYQVAVARRLYKHLHTPGVHTGLQVSAVTAAGDVTISPGIAYDGYGREIYIAPPQPAPIRAIHFVPNTFQILFLAFNEEMSGAPQSEAPPGIPGNPRFAQRPLIVAVTVESEEDEKSPFPRRPVTIPGGITLQPQAFVRLASIGSDGLFDGRLFAGIRMPGTSLSFQSRSHNNEAVALSGTLFVERELFVSDILDVNDEELAVARPATLNAGIAVNGSMMNLIVGTQQAIFSSRENAVTGLGDVPYSALTDAPQAVWKNSAGSVRRVIDHNGYDIDRTDDVYEGWRHFTAAASQFNAQTLFGQWIVSTQGTTSGVALNEAANEPSADFPSRSIQLRVKATGDTAHVTTGNLCGVANDISLVAMWEARVESSGDMSSQTSLSVGLIAHPVVRIVIVAAGALGTMTFRYSVNGGGLSQTPTSTSGSPFVFSVPGTAMKITFSAGTYVAESEYLVTTVVTRTSGPDTVRWSTESPTIYWGISGGGSPSVCNVFCAGTQGGGFPMGLAQWRRFRIEVHGAWTPFGQAHGGAVARFFADDALFQSLSIPASIVKLGFKLHAQHNGTALSQPAALQVGPIRLRWNRFGSLPSV